MTTLIKTGIQRSLVTLSLFTMLVLCLLALSTTSGYAEPKSAPGFDLPNLLDPAQKISLDDFRGKVVLLNIWASWCPGCLDEMPELMELQERFGKSPFTVLGVAIDNKRANALSFLERIPPRDGRQVNFPVLHDAGKKFVRSLNPTLMPTSYLIDTQGRIVRIFAGSITERTLPDIRSAIEKEIEAKP